jgi:hypothetical protein
MQSKIIVVMNIYVNKYPEITIIVTFQLFIRDYIHSTLQTDRPKETNPLTNLGLKIINPTIVLRACSSHAPFVSTS